MNPSIGRSIRGGFKTANSSGSGIVCFAGSLILAMLITFLVFALTNPPKELFQERTTTKEKEIQPIAVEPEQSDFQQPQAEQAVPVVSGEATQESSAPETQAGDLFQQLAQAPETAGQQAQIAEGQTQKTDDIGRAQLTEHDRIVTQWVEKSWPLLLFCFFVLSLANLWLSAGQIKYLSRKIKGESARGFEILRVGARTLGSLVVVSILLLLAFLVSLIAFVFIMWLLGILGQALPGLLVVLVGLAIGLSAAGFLIWLFVKASLWFITVAADNLGPFAGLTMSFRATRGNRWWKVLSLWVLAFLVLLGISLPFNLLGSLTVYLPGLLALVINVVLNALGFAATLYAGFAMLASVIIFYEDTKSEQRKNVPAAG